MTSYLAYISETTESGARVQRISSGTSSNASGSPTLQDYLSAELDSGFVECSRGKNWVITVSAADLNAA